MQDAVVLAPPAPPTVVDATCTVESSGVALRASLPPALQQHMRECTPEERRAAELWVMHGNKSRAWRVAYGHEHERPCQRHWSEAMDVFARPWVLAYVRELRAGIAAAHVLDVAAIISADRAIVEAAEHADAISRIEYQCCRHCHGVGFKYQWRDAEEYAHALAAAMDDNTQAALDHKRAKPLPSDDGGYGFDSRQEPHAACPTCEGRGVMVTVFGDTRNLGPAKPLFRGVKQTANGIEVLTHDVEKAKDRLLRTAGAYHDDAASVARGAAAGAAAGASAGAVASAVAAAKAAASLTAEQCQKLYLQVIGG